ncbi:MAG: hypothetical protein EZS28_040774, partial [Streblomastix strix]
MSKNSIKPEPSEPGLFVNFDTPKFTTKTPVATAVEQPEMRDQIENFLMSEQQPTLQDIERQLTPSQTVSERTQALMAKVLEAMTGVKVSQIKFWAMNILDEQNDETRRCEIQYPSLLPIKQVPVPDEILDSKRSLIDKILQSEQALTLYNFRQDDSQFKENRENAFCKSAKRERDQRKLLQLSCEFNQFTSGQLNRVSYVWNTSNCKDGRCEKKMLQELLNSLFGIQQQGQGRVRTKNFRQLTQSAIWKQIIRPMITQNENQTLEHNHEAQIAIAYNDMPSPNSEPRDRPPPGRGQTGPYTLRYAMISQTTIFPPSLITEQEIPEIP